MTQSGAGFGNNSNLISRESRVRDRRLQGEDRNSLLERRSNAVNAFNAYAGTKRATPAFMAELEAQIQAIDAALRRPQRNDRLDSLRAEKADIENDLNRESNVRQIVR